MSLSLTPKSGHWHPHIPSPLTEDTPFGPEVRLEVEPLGGAKSGIISQVGQKYQDDLT